MIDLDSLERSLAKVDARQVLDASDFARLRRLSLVSLNALIQEVSHEMYGPKTNEFEARASVVSLINLGLLSPSAIYGNRQYA